MVKMVLHLFSSIVCYPLVKQVSLDKYYCCCNLVRCLQPADEGAKQQICGLPLQSCFCVHLGAASMHFFSIFVFYATRNTCSSHAFLHFFVPLDLDIGKYPNALCSFFPARFIEDFQTFTRAQGILCHIFSTLMTNLIFFFAEQ